MASVFILVSLMMLVWRLLRKALDSRENKKISTDDLTKMAEFVLKNHYFQFNGKVKKLNFFKPWFGLVWFRYINDAFFIWT